MRCLRKNLKQGLPLHFITLDTEGYPVKTNIIKKLKQPDVIELEEHKLAFGYAFYCELDKSSYTRTDELYFTTPEDITKFIINKSDWSKPLIVFAHNFSYDFRLCINQQALQDAGFSLNFAVVETNFIMKYCHINKIKKKNRTIIFLSTTNYFRNKLSELGKSIKLEKLEMDFENDKENSFREIINRTDRAKDYCYRDVEILEAVVLRFLMFINGKCNFSYTIASTAFNIFRHIYYQDNIILHDNIEVERIEREGYYGGRVEAFKIGMVKDITVLDVNSMYPFVLLQDYPNQMVTKFKFMEPEQLLNFMKEYFVVSKVKIHITERKIPVKYEDKLIFPIGTFITTLYTPELELLKPEEILEVYNTVIYTKEKLFFTFIMDMYNSRLKAKEEDDDVMSYFFKIIMNSFGSKWAQKVRKTIRAKELDGMTQFGVIDFLEDNKKTSVQYINGEAFIIANDKVCCPNGFTAISAAMTSYARAYLYKLIELAGIENVVYCDTDSLFLTQTGYNLLLPILGEKLGQMKINDEIVIENKKEIKLKEEHINVNIKGLKDYEIIRDKYKIIKIKSVPKKLLYNDNNIYIYNRFIGLKESIRYYNMLIGTITVKKILKREYKKGIIHDNDIFPIEL